jgi:phage-related protein
LAYLVLLAEGPRFTVYAFAHANRQCKVEDFFASEDRSESEVAQLQALYKRVAQHGVIFNVRKCRPLGGGLYEFKTRGGARLVWFYDEQRLIIATHGFWKQGQKTPKQEIDTAQVQRAAYYEAKNAGRLRPLPDFNALQSCADSAEPDREEPDL